MKLFERKSTTVQAFHLPLWGKIASETPPDWLVTRLQSGLFELNSLGGLTMSTPWGVKSCLAGDVVILFEDDSIDFEKPDKFTLEFGVIASQSKAGNSMASVS